MEQDGGREEDKVEEMEEEGGGSLAPVLNKRLHKKQYTEKYTKVHQGFSVGRSSTATPGAVLCELLATSSAAEQA